MGKPKLDKDTQRVMEQTKISHDWVASEGYKRFKKIVMEKIVQQTSLLRLSPTPNATNDSLVRDYTARQLLGGLLVQTLQEIEGEAGSYESNMKLLNNEEENSLYAFLPEKVEE